MSQSSPSFGLPGGSLRAGFEAAARAHAALRDASGSGALPAMRQILAPRAANPIEAAIADAANRTTVDFGYLLAQAEVESAMNPDAAARSSSATGLYQFIESTWLDTLKRHGPRFGYGALADSIAVTPSGSAHVADPARRAEILALRRDPQLAALMAAGLAEDNRAHLAPILGRQPDHAELYLAHFLGAGGAGRFLSELQANPSQSAPALFARPAAANRAIFYDPDGSPRTLAQVMDVIGTKMARALDRASDAGGIRLARADYGAAQAQYGGLTPAPYLIADEAVFDPLQPAVPSAAPPRIPMSQVLGNTFGSDPATVPLQVRRAYDQLRAFGL